ncbi:MAG: twin-arginine translocation signal domain-containing protein, partial [Anaerolineae bacterium]|nr:twin-arginine translocation signal domain-containing protein [Anaerolineae bacterium]
MSDIPRDEITPEYVYMNRRRFIQAALLAAGGAVLAACTPSLPTTS